MKKVLILAFLLLFQPLPVMATTWYVQKTGSDSNNCTQAQSTSTPKLTIQAALNCVGGSAGAGADDFVEIRDSTAQVYDESFAAFPTGTSGHPFTLKATNNGVVSIFPTSGDKVFKFEGNEFQYITLGPNLIINGGNLGSFCISISGSGGTDITVTGNEIKNCFLSGVYIGLSQNFRASLNHIHDIGQTILDHGIYCETGGADIEQNLIHDIKGFGIHCFSSSFDISNNTVKSNLIHDWGQDPTREGAAIIVQNSNARVSGNIAYHGDGGAIACNSGSVDCWVWNNSVNDTTGEGVFIGSGSTGARIINNGLLNNAGGAINDLGSGTTASNNVSSGTDTALWIDPANGNFSLKSTAATMLGQGITAIGSGTNACKNSSNPDIGAIQSLANPVVQVNAAAFTMTYTNNCTDQILPSAPTGFSFLKNGVNDAISSIGRTSANVFSGIVANAFVFNNTCNYSYSQSSGNVVSNNNVGNAPTTNQEAFTVTNSACTNNTPPGSLNLVKILLGTVGMRMGNGKSVNAGLIP